MGIRLDRTWITGFALALALLVGCPNADDDNGDDDADDDDDATADDDADDDSAGDDDTTTSNSDVSVDFTAAAPYTYDHYTGGGAYNDRTVGDYDDIVESLQGGEFACGDIVTFLTAIVVEDEIGAETLTLEIEYRFLAQTTGQPGAAFGDVVVATMNYGAVTNGDGTGGTDAGVDDDHNSSATLVSVEFIPSGTDLFEGAEELVGVVQIDDLEAGEQTILRVDTVLLCEAGTSPTGNLQAQLNEARLVAANGQPIDPPNVIPGGSQTIPFQQVGDISGIDPS